MKKYSFLLILVLISLQAKAQYGNATFGYNYERNSFERTFVHNTNLEGKIGLGFGHHLEANLGLLWMPGSSLFDSYPMNEVLIEEEDGSISHISLFSHTRGFGLNYNTKFYLKSHENQNPEGLYLGSSIGFNQIKSDLFVDEVLNDNGSGFMPNNFYESKYKSLDEQQINSLKMGLFTGVAFEGSRSNFNIYTGMNRNFIMNTEEVLFPNHKWSLMFGFSSGLIF